MKMTGLLLFACVLFLEIGLQWGWLRILQQGHINQILKSYGPQGHIEKKKGTPTMGGVVFLAIASILAIFFPLSGYWGWRDSLAILGFPLAGGAIGLADDLLKHDRKSSEGFTSLQKLLLQAVISCIWAAIYMSDGSFGVAPGIYLSGTWGFLMLVFILVGALNAVNITDGLDGLASGACSISFLGFLAVTPEFSPESVGAIIGLGLAVGFLKHNMNPAKVFMGDCGSHFLGGLLISICVSSNLTILILPFGFLMGIEVLTVIIQIIAIRVFSKKVFLMSPIHHHFEMIGWSEKTVVLSFWAFHLVGMSVLSAIIIMLFF